MARKNTPEKEAGMRHSIMLTFSFLWVKRKTVAGILHCHVTAFSAFHDFFPGAGLFISDVFPSQEF